MQLLVILILAVAAGLFAILPPRAIMVAEVAAESDDLRPVRGAIHIHTSRSDGTGSIEEVARAAARAGLSFIVLTDHGDGTTPPEPPSYQAGVLVVDAVEISTEGGHVVAIGVQKSPYPLGGEARDVVEDVHRLGGWAMAAHPGSPKPELAWQDWSVPIDGIEWINGDSEWRDERMPSLLRVLASYPFRRAEALVTLLDRPLPVMQRWDELQRHRQVVGVAASDAHARVGITTLGEPYDARATFPFPSYEAIFSALSITLPGVRLTEDASVDADAVIRALREGRVYSAIDGLARGGSLTVKATSGQGSAEPGQRLAVNGPVSLSVQAHAPPGSRIVIYRNGVAVDSSEVPGHEFTGSAEPAVYRVEVALPEMTRESAVPWLVSNPIYVGSPGEPAAPPSIATAAAQRPWTDAQLNTARIERSEASEGAVSMTRAVGTRELLFRFALGGRPSDHPYAAVVLPVPAPLEPTMRLQFRGRSDRVMRASIQLRSPGAGAGDRWRRSIYLDDTERAYDIPLAEMRAVGGLPLEQRLQQIDSLLIVADAVNTALGNGGRVWIRDLVLVK